MMDVMVDILRAGLLIFISNILLITLIIYGIWRKLFDSQSMEESLAIREKRETLYSTKGVSIFTYKDEYINWMIYFVFCIYIFAIVVMYNIYNLEFVDNIYKNVNNICSACISFTGIVLTCFAFVISLKKNYYLFFSIREACYVLNVDFYGKRTIVSCMLLHIINLFLHYKNEADIIAFFLLLVFEVAVIINTVCACVLLWKVWMLACSTKRIELKKMLSQLYRVLKNAYPDTSQMNGDWERGVGMVNINWLVEDYLYRCKKSKLSRVKQFEFATSVELYKDKWYEKAAKRYEVVLVVIYLFVLMLIGIFIQRNTIVICVFGLSWVLFLVQILLPLWRCETINLFIFRLFLGTWGYYFFDGKEHFTHRYLMLPSKYKRFMQANINLITFFYLALLLEQDVKEMLDSVIAEIRRYNSDNKIIYLPIFVIGILVEQKNGDIQSVKELYKELKFEGKEELEFKIMALGYVSNFSHWLKVDDEQLEKVKTDYWCKVTGKGCVYEG